LKRVEIPEATYHYHIKRLSQENPNEAWKVLIIETFKKHEGRYGYRRIHAELEAQGYTINHKKVQRIMQELNLKCEKFMRKSRYKSYKGTVGTVAKNPFKPPFQHTLCPSESRDRRNRIQMYG
jgi:putative transposase